MISRSKLADLSGADVYEMFMLRQQVFMLEQNCLYQDIDKLDSEALHFRYMNDKGQLLGYLRLLPPTQGSDMAIGRVAVKKKARRAGLAREMMDAALQVCASEFPNKIIRLAAQTYLIDFYSSFGFSEVGRTYIEDDIPHQDMHLYPV